MYHEKKHSMRRWVIALCAVLLFLLLICFSLFRTAGSDMEDETTTAVEDAIRRCALQCYAIEGVYPDSIEYLEENYGLSVNHRDYYITYDAFAENVAPEIRVVRKS